MNVILTIPKKKALRRTLDRLAGEPFCWVYLGGDLGDRHRLQLALSGKGEFIDTSALFHQAAESLRQAYQDYLSRLGEEQKSLRWWLSTISYRDFRSSHAFYGACWVRTTIRLLSSWDRTKFLVIVVGEAALGETLRVNLAPHATVTGIGLPASHILSPIVGVLQVAAHRIVFLLVESWRLLLARLMVPSASIPSSPLTVIACAADGCTLGIDGPFKESFFGDLADQLVKRGHPVAFVPLIFRGTPYREALRILCADSLLLLVPHRYLSLRDLLWAVKETLPRLQLPGRRLPLLDGIDITCLVREDIRRDWISNWSAESLLMVALVTRWAKMRLLIDRIIYPYENQPWERALCWATTRLFPATDLVAFQHSRLPRMLLKFFLGSGEEMIQPQPHRIVTLGVHSARLLLDNGHSADRIRVGGALRHQRFLALCASGLTASPDPERPLVVVGLSYEWEDTAEIIEALSRLADLPENVQVVVKAHPRVPVHMIFEKYGVALPAGLQSSEKPLSALLRGATVMVYGASTACLEGLAMEVPLVHVRPRLTTDHDPLELATDVRLEAKDGNELHEKVLWLIRNREAYVARYRAQWKTLVRDMFSPITEETYQAFLGDKLAGRPLQSGMSESPARSMSHSVHI